MKASKFCLFFLFLIISITAGSAQVKIKFVNRTEKILDSLVVNKVQIGHLDPDSATAFISFDQVYFDTGFPEFKMQAWIDTSLVTTLDFPRCHTQVKAEIKGSYTYYIKYFKTNSSHAAFLQVNGYPKIFSLKELGLKEN